MDYEYEWQAENVALAVKHEAMVTTTPIPLTDWIQRVILPVPSSNQYVESAVCVALELANCICLSVESEVPHRNSLSSSISSSLYHNGSSSVDISSEPNREDAVPSSSLMRVELKHLVPENVIIHVVNCGGLPYENPTAVRSVNIRSPSANVDNYGLYEMPQLLSEEDLCSALGRILFSLFSRGQPMFTIEVESNHDEIEFAMKNEEDEDRGSRPLDQGLKDTAKRTRSTHEFLTVSPGSNVVFPPRKLFLPRKNAGSVARPRAMQVKQFLQDQYGLPISISRLMSDLLQTEGSAALLKAARVDLIQMILHPQRYLHDRTSLIRALDDTGLFQQTTDAKLFGRDEDVCTLQRIAERVSSHVSSSPSPLSMPTKQFSCEVALISGRSGSGKSALMSSLISSRDTEEWFVLRCKFDVKVAPILTIAKSLNNFFERFLREDHSEQDLFKRISPSIIISSLDTELLEMMPVFSRLFPHSTNAVQRNGNTAGNVGSGRNRLKYLFHLLLRSLFCAGKPVLIVLDDLQWSDNLAADVISDLVQNIAYQTVELGSKSYCGDSQDGLFLLAGYRTNEGDTSMIRQFQTMDQSAGNTKMTHLSVGELSTHDISEMMSFKLGLPARCIKQLAESIFRKTRGHPLFVTNFIRSIISKDMLSFSVRDRQWTWDLLVLDLLTISEDVAEFLAHGLNRLDRDVLQTLKLCSCIGFQVKKSMLELLDLGQFVPDVLSSLELAMKEGLMEKAGPIFAFSHDMLKEATYNLMQVSERKTLHKKIGLSLCQGISDSEDAEICIAAVDQINGCRDILDAKERPLFAQHNLSAGKHSMKSSSYEQARGYFEAGISLLHSNQWERQYVVCLQLHELSALSGFMNANVKHASSRLDDIFANGKSFQDKLRAHALSIKVIASRGEYAEAARRCLSILAGLGEHLPEVSEISTVANEIERTQALLKDVTKDDILALPTLTDASKLHAMQFLSMLCTFSMFFQPHVCYLSSCHMTKLTWQFGFCDESVHGLAAFSRCMLLHTNNVGLNIERARRIGSLAESVLIRHSDRCAIEVKLMDMLRGPMASFVQPLQALPELFWKGFNSGMMVGNIEYAMLFGQLWCLSKFQSGTELKTLQGPACDLLRVMAKHKQYGVLHGTMSIVGAVSALTGSNAHNLGIKTNEEISRIATQTKNSFLLYHVLMNQMSINFYFREYAQVIEIYEKNEIIGVKRIIDFMRVFFVGISALSLARDTHQAKWKDIGERCIQTMTNLASHFEWNFLNKLHLLRAELHYLNGDLDAAEIAFMTSIATAHRHKFIHEEALAAELYGIFLIENKCFDRGVEQLKTSLSNYAKWGADIKVKSLESFLEFVKDASRGCWNWN